MGFWFLELKMWLKPKFGLIFYRLAEANGNIKRYATLLSAESNGNTNEILKLIITVGL